MPQDAYRTHLLDRNISRRRALALFGGVALVAAATGRAGAQDDQAQGLGAGGRSGGGDAAGGMAEVQPAAVGGSGRTGGQMTVTAMPATGAGIAGIDPAVAAATLLAAGGAAAVAIRGGAVTPA